MTSPHGKILISSSRATRSSPDTSAAHGDLLPFWLEDAGTIAGFAISKPSPINPQHSDSSNYRSIFGTTRGVSFQWIRRVKRSLNNDLDLIPLLALQAGGHRFDPGHVHQNFILSFLQLTVQFPSAILRGIFWSIWSDYGFWKVETVPDVEGAYIDFCISLFPEAGVVLASRQKSQKLMTSSTGIVGALP